MVVKTITQKLLETTPLFYSRWHSVVHDGKSFYDLQVGKLVGPIISIGVDKSMFAVCHYLTDLVEMPTDFEDVNGLRVWDKDIGTLYIENLDTGIRYEGSLESLSDDGEGLNVIGTYCMFTTDLEEAYVETFFHLLETLRPKGRENDKDLENVNHFINQWEEFMRENYPERVLGVI